MARYAMIDPETNEVVNVIEWDGSERTWKPPEGFTMVEDVDGVASPGSKYQAKKFVAPKADIVE